MIPESLLQRLRIGDRPSIGFLDSSALMDVAELLGIGGDYHNRVIDFLDFNYQGWRGYPVTETEGKRDA